MQSRSPYCAVDLCLSWQLLFLLVILKVYREPPSTAHSFITNNFLIDTKFHKLVGFFLHFVEMFIRRWRIWKSIIKQTLINLWLLLLTCKNFSCAAEFWWNWNILCDLNLLANDDWMKSNALRDTARNNFTISSLLSIFFLYQTNEKTIAEFFNDTKRETVGGCWRCRSIKLFNIVGIYSRLSDNDRLTLNLKFPQFAKWDRRYNRFLMRQIAIILLGFYVQTWQHTNTIL